MSKTNELDKLIEEYDKVFEDGFPTYPLLNRGEDKCMAIIKNCLRKNKDVYDLGYLSLDEDTLY